MKSILLISLILGAAVHASELPDNACLVDQKALTELKKQRSAYEEKLKSLSEKENELEKREQAVKEEIAKLQALKSEIQGVKLDQKKQSDEKVAKFVETVEAMSPKAASALLSKVELSLAVSAATKMTTQRLAKIMNLMDPVKASQLTEAMTKGSILQ
ncbi:MAG: hypothetical protein KA715_06400 [Xanthomonadaceae bacterium]|nr:hypothetical protein [Xanthomonadaceae bacterium]